MFTNVFFRIFPPKVSAQTLPLRQSRPSTGFCAIEPPNERPPSSRGPQDTDSIRRIRTADSSGRRRCRCGNRAAALAVAVVVMAEEVGAVVVAESEAEGRVFREFRRDRRPPRERLDRRDRVEVMIHWDHRMVVG